MLSNMYILYKGLSLHSEEPSEPDLTSLSKNFLTSQHSSVTGAEITKGDDDYSQQMRYCWLF